MIARKASRALCPNRTASSLALFILGCGLAPSAFSAEPPHPDTERALQKVHAATGPTRISALRSLWRTWDRSDPIHVERALRTLAADSTLDPASRAYAGLLSAYARRRRGDLDGARLSISRLGYVNRWLVLGPFDNDGKTGLNRSFTPEVELGKPLDLSSSYEGKERPARWRSVPDVYPYGWLDTGDLVRPAEKICVFATTFVHANRARKASVWFGSSGAYRMFWNGEEVSSDEAYRELDAERYAVSLDAKSGWNRLTIKLCGEDHGPMLSLRIADDKGAPDPSLEVSNTLDHAQDAARNAVGPTSSRETGTLTLAASGSQGKVSPNPAPPKRKQADSLRGPLAVFEQLVKGAKPSAQAMEDFARYLMLTGADDSTDHRARDFSRKAAEAAPTIERALLASKLSEDRNQQREWVQKAVELAGATPSVDVLLAQAVLARTGPNWRDAIPFYDKALSIEQDNVDAILGRVDLYNEAGLKRTALVSLERAVERNSLSVGLLRALAQQLRSLDRETEANEAEERYAALRFDDTGFHQTRMALALERRDAPMAQHWIQRMLASDPDSSDTLLTAARAYISLGMPPMAISTFQKAVEMAPDDTNVRIAFADLLGELGRRGEQVEQLRTVLQIRPQSEPIRAYLDSMEAQKTKPDEAYAWAPDKFLALRGQAASGFNSRTLRDLQVTTVYPNGLSSRFHQIVFQPMTEAAAISARRYTFSYQAASESLSQQSAKVYRADGKVDEAISVRTGPADDPSVAMYTSTQIVAIDLPKLSAGDVVEVRYRLEALGDNNDFADYFGEFVSMQSSEPVLSSEYVVIAPKQRTLLFHTGAIPGLVTENKQEVGSNNVYRFHAENLPAVIPEPNMPSWSELLGKVHVSTYRSWEDVGKWYWGLSKDQLVPDGEVRARVEQITKGLTDDSSKVKAIYDYVVQRTRYVALEFGIEGFRPRRASQTFARGWGDCKDKAALIVTMLRVLNIPASMVLVRTSDRGDFPTELASIAPFNHAIAYVPSLDLYLDGTAEYTGSTELPSMDRNALALVVSENSVKLTHLPDPPPENTVRSRRLEATLAANGSANLDMQYESSGAFAAHWRVRYHGESTRRSRLSEDLAIGLSGFELQAGPSAVEVSDFENIEKPVSLRVKGKAPSFARAEGGDLSVPMTPFESFLRKLAPQSQRKHDIRLPFQSTVDETWTIRLPVGMVVKNPPTPSSKTGSFGSYELGIEQRDGTVVVHAKVIFKKTRILASEYPAFQAYCEEIDRAMSQRLLVGRK